MQYYSRGMSCGLAIFNDGPWRCTDERGRPKRLLSVSLSGRMVSSGISDIAIASVHSE